MPVNHLQKFLDDTAAVIGQQNVESDSETRRVYGRHTLPFADVPPPAVVCPGSTEQIQQIVRLANKHRIALYPISTGRNLGLGSRAPAHEGQVVVDLGRRMNRILEINDDLGYCVVEPGVTFQALHDELIRRGSSLMISPTAGPSDGSLLGNALDKGGGAGPYGDHFGNTCGIEVVLGNGEVIRTGDGAHDTAVHRNWHVTKYSFGPALDGLFTQSNFGIVSQLGMWLMQRPRHMQLFFFSFPDAEDLGDIIDSIRPLKAANVVPTLIRATNDLYLLSAQECSPDYKSGQTGALSRNSRAKLQEKYGVGAWIVSGAVYGATPEAVAPTITRVVEQFCHSGKARYISHDEAECIPALRVAINSNTGIPTSGELNMLQWRPGGGAVWFTPGTPMTGGLVNDLQRRCRAICAEQGLDYMASNVCGPRFARGVHAIIFNREDAAEAARADRCYRAMSEAFAAEGIFVGRAPTAYQDYHHRQRLPAMVDACSAIKRALDPNGIIAPGRYGMY